MTQERAPERERSLVGEESGTTSEVARDCLANPEEQRTSWLATTRPDGRPHLMPVIAFWIDGAIHVVAGEGTRKARNLASDGRCVIATSSTTLPSLDIVVRAAPIRSSRATPLDTSPGSSAPAAGHLRPRGQGLPSKRPNRRPAAVHDLPDRPVEGVRPPRHVRDGSVRSGRSAATDALGLRQRLTSTGPRASVPRLIDRLREPGVRAHLCSSAIPNDPVTSGPICGCLAGPGVMRRMGPSLRGD
jgi:hypothetical protein